MKKILSYLLVTFPALLFVFGMLFTPLAQAFTVSSSGTTVTMTVTTGDLPGCSLPTYGLFNIFGDSNGSITTSTQAISSLPKTFVLTGVPNASDWHYLRVKCGMLSNSTIFTGDGTWYQFAASDPFSTPFAPPVVEGCTDNTATNYNSLATHNDGSCTYPAPTGTISDHLAGTFTQDTLPIIGTSVKNNAPKVLGIFAGLTGLGTLMWYGARFIGRR